MLWLLNSELTEREGISDFRIIKSRFMTKRNDNDLGRWKANFTEKHSLISLMDKTLATQVSVGFI